MARKPTLTKNALAPKLRPDSRHAAIARSERDPRVLRERPNYRGILCPLAPTDVSGGTADASVVTDLPYTYLLPLVYAMLCDVYASSHPYVLGQLPRYLGMYAHVGMGSLEHHYTWVPYLPRYVPSERNMYDV
jgi:hypothetical protein